MSWCIASDIYHHSSDHVLLGATIRTRISNVFTTKGKKCRRLNVAALQVPEKRKEFRDQKLGDQGEETTALAQMRNAMNQVAEEVIGF
jgi:hypothetical protein